MTNFSTPLRLLGLAFLVLLASLTVSSCITAPDYSDTPSIDFKRITKERYVTGSGTFDSVKVTISFKDGDGDLGLSNDETNSPYQEKNTDGTANRFYNNYFFQAQILRNGEYKDTILNGIPYDSRYPLLNTSGRAEPLKGELTLSQEVFAGTFPTGSKVRYKVSIVDRALHESNTILTDPIQF
ncbi:hypothetical protein [Hymenobacter cavernae]|uniref:DUF3823 domain-containing protein n=1 Tax=Hymenobacter cavernae TaxID=2044852 RepID=A0ABQ1U8W3_9BACT|nr:hypothetical protein [Hymenobacter cavernae]GGF12949.1 hypothetical protein GCM10011383_25130 [Hymenobacter cavernae]